MNFVNVPIDMFKVKNKAIGIFSVREFFSILVSGFLFFIIYNFFFNFLGIASIPFALIPVFFILTFGFYNDDGIYLEKLIPIYINYLKNRKPKVYKSKNTYRVYINTIRDFENLL